MRQPSLSSPVAPTPRAPKRVHETCARVAEMARALGTGAKLPRVTQLRDELNVSLTTLNAALGELEANGIIRRQHGVGLFVAKTTRTLALVCHPAHFRGAGTSPFWDLLLEAAKGRAAEHGEELRLQFAPEDVNAPLDAALLLDIERGRIDGVIGVGLGPAAVRSLESQGAVFVSFAGMGRVTVGIDLDAMLSLGVAELARRGARRIAMWRPVTPYRPLYIAPDEANAERDAHETTFATCVRAHGLEFEASLVHDLNRRLKAPGDFERESHQEQGYRLALEVFGAPNPPDAVLVVDDLMTRGALSAWHKLGLKAGCERPADVLLASHCNAGSPALLGHEEEFVALQIDPGALVDSLFESVETALSGEPVAVSHVLLAPQVREA